MTKKDIQPESRVQNNPTRLACAHVASPDMLHLPPYCIWSHAQCMLEVCREQEGAGVSEDPRCRRSICIIIIAELKGSWFPHVAGDESR
jgi:hypothetical protein